MSARVAGYLHLAKRATRKERVLFERDSRGIRMTNGLGAKIKGLSYRTADGKLYKVDVVEAGQTVEMTEGPVKDSGGAKGEEAIRMQSNLTLSALLNSSPALVGVSRWEPGPGEYLCEVEGSVFLEDGTGGSGKQKGRGVVVGLADVTEKGK